MRRFALGLALVGVGWVGVGQSEELPSYPKPEKPSASEPVLEAFSAKKAGAYLDNVSVNWTRDRKCGTCHTNYPYLIARPLLDQKSAGLAEVRKFFEDRVRHWDRGKPKDAPRWDTEVVATAVGLAINDAQTTGKLHPLTKKALDRMWTVQGKDGAWDWLKCDWPPMEHDDYYGATYAALGVGLAPENYVATEKAQAGLKKLRRYFADNKAPDLHHEAMLLWASMHVSGLLEPKAQSKIVEALWKKQRADGGWSLPSLGDWKRRDDSPNNPKADSDGYATGLVVYVLRQSKVPSADPRLRKAVEWLKSNQRRSGRWFTRSLNTDRYHYISNAGTAFAILALQACGSL